MTEGVKRIIIIRYGEVALKGMNKPYFEKKLMGRIDSALRDFSGLSLKRSNGLFVLSAAGEDAERLPYDEAELMRRIGKVFGVASVSPAFAVYDRSMETIKKEAIHYMGERLGSEPVTFKVFGKRSDKTYPVTSPEMAAAVGEALLAAYPGRLKVDVHKPDIELYVHLRPQEVFIYDEKVSGYGGLPLGTNGKGLVLLSGGIDSPVAAWLMAKRGMKVEALHFHSYPYTSLRAQTKVEELAGILASYCGHINMHVVNLLPAQEAIAKHCPEEYMTLLVRRFMMKIAELIAIRERCNMLVTGENLGQVASQTAESLLASDSAVKSLPVMRPLIALDKTDIMDKAREIGSYEKSIEPYEDCCTVFLPKHPVTRPTLSAVLEAEALIPDADELVRTLAGESKLVRIK